MKILGAVLVLLSSGLVYRRRRGWETEELRLGEALYGDLAVLGYRICVLRQPLPELLSGHLADSAAWDGLWGPLLRALETGEEGAPACWRQAAEALPPRLGTYLAPLGPLLAVGGERLDRAVEETREELAGFLRDERQRQAQQGRLTAAVCLSGAGLLILLLV